ncbi:hypothetical protein Bca52824_042727 [Brassica carinata]|uniref:Uncharacterized protein n=1 Tax=Brassica carinata TaxID=52824 RepID=A0A8X7RYV7_BRACI|nr:hypothetical protein Bca52824_042727 [Brassica carinata]
MTFHRNTLRLIQTKDQKRSFTVSLPHPHRPVYAAPPPFLSLIPTDLLIESSHLSSLYYTPDIAAAPSHQGFYGAKLHWLNLCLQVTAGPIVQECCFARVAHDYVTAASLSHYAVSSIDGSSQSRSSFPNLLVAGTIVQEYGLARITNYITAASPSHYAVSNIDGSSQSLLYLLSAICSHMLGLDECDDCMLRSLSDFGLSMLPTVLELLT